MENTLIRKVFPIVFWLILIGYALLRAWSITDSQAFLQTYKFFTNDSYTWLVDGMFLFESTEINFRNPGLPLIIKLLDQLNLLYLLAYLNQLVLIGIIAGLIRIMKNLAVSNFTIILIIPLLMLNYSIQAYSDYILADYYAIVMLTWATALLLEKKLKISFSLLGLSAIFQNFAFFLVPLWLVTHFFFKEKITVKMGRRKLSLVVKKYLRMEYRSLPMLLFFFLLPTLLWWGYKFALFGDPLYTRVVQFGLLKPNLDGLTFYLFNSLTIFGLFWLPIFMFYLYKLPKLIQKQPRLVILLAGGLITLIFWIICYDWNDRRFLLYALPMIIPLIGTFADGLQKKAWLIPVFLLVNFYPGFFALNGFFTSTRLPLTDNYAISYELITPEMKGALLSGEPRLVEFNFDDTKNGSFLLGSLRNPEYYRSNESTKFSAYTSLIERAYDEENNVFCVNHSEEYRQYLVEAIFYIAYDKPYSEVEVVENCNNEKI